MEHEERLKAALADRYQIEREIGSGGMATVYLAQDPKHDRQVAVKVLKPELAAVVGTDRFLAEIRTTANLSHPHILPLHDSGEADGFLFYVMPYVEGESLRQRLDRDGQLPVEEAVRIASRVADALESAHRHGVIHRDLKPANILFQEGEPVVADFGIALAVSAAGEGRLTETGLSLGTPYYMSPEQAAGDQAPTAASDVYSLGCVLYEMLTGDPPHTGSSAQAILGKILLGEVTRPTKLRRTIPANVEGVLLKALERLPADRFESVAELAAALKDKGFRHGVGVGEVVGGPWKGLAIGLGGTTVLAVALAVTGVLGPNPSAPAVQRQEIHPPGDGAVRDWARYFALAPDGSSMVYRATGGVGSGWRLWIKERGSAEGRPLSGTEGARDVVYSPDGEWIAYKVGTDFIKRPIQGAGTQTLLEGMDPNWMGVSWMADGTILCEQAGGTLVRIPEDPGSPPDTVIVWGADTPNWVHGLPGEKAALVVRCLGPSCGGGTPLSVVDLQTDSTWVLLDEVLRAWYVPTGHLVWVRRDGNVFATPFDLDRLELSDAHVPLFEGVRTSPHLADMAMGQDGTIVFVQGASTSGVYEPVWVDREGREVSIDLDLAGDIRDPALSPDGTRLALSVTSWGEPGEEVWIAQLDRGSTHKLTFEGGGYPTWSPDGRSVTFYSDRRSGNMALWTKFADGSGNAELLLQSDRAFVEAVWSPDSARVVLRTSQDSDGAGDLMIWEVGDDTEPLPLVATEFREVAPALSPNGHFLAYTSNESGVDQVYVCPFPNVEEGRWQVSTGVGTEPVWAKNRPELFYRKGAEGDLVAVEVATADSFRVGEEHILFPAGGYTANDVHHNYDVGPDGQHFVMLRPADDAERSTEPRMIMIQNWFTELEERLGEGR